MPRIAGFTRLSQLLRHPAPIISPRIRANQKMSGMSRYYVNNNSQPNGDHEVHVQGCYWLQQATRTRDLGNHTHCRSAVAMAKVFYPTANGGATCASDCHTT